MFFSVAFPFFHVGQGNHRLILRDMINYVQRIITKGRWYLRWYTAAVEVIALLKLDFLDFPYVRPSVPLICPAAPVDPPLDHSIPAVTNLACLERSAAAGPPRRCPRKGGLAGHKV